MLFYLLLFFSLATVVDNTAELTGPSIKKQEMEELTQKIKNTNEKLQRLTTLVFEQVVEMRKLVEEESDERKKNFKETSQRLDELARLSDERHNQTFEEMKRTLDEANNGRIEELATLVDQRNNLTLENFNQTNASDLAKQNHEELIFTRNLTLEHENRTDTSDLANEQHNKSENSDYLVKCPLARFANLTMLSNGKMYSFHQIYENWNAANESCNKMGLHLATIKDQKDAQVVAEEGQKFGKWEVWWVSAKNSGIEGRRDFRWHDGTKLEMDSPLWKAGADKTEDCVFIFNYGNNDHCPNSKKLHTYLCNYVYYFICELPSSCF
ncbi:C-type lectin domain family 4 member F-like [Neocloeon triangulifer]|uniref:C-type lectin domain family 4 member F-like n=1 Tax=Neocloeon triangulifer TaxID=2078957 RepID=UPI00286EDFC9|nr:C-type lectin domain family 4 member F-like [Neocloeon triangulifer]